MRTDRQPYQMPKVEIENHTTKWFAHLSLLILVVILAINLFFLYTVTISRNNSTKYETFVIESKKDTERILRILEHRQACIEVGGNLIQDPIATPSASVKVGD